MDTCIGMAESLCCAPEKSHIIHWLYSNIGLPWRLSVKESLPANEGDAGSVPRLGISPGGGNATHSSILALKMDRGAWQAGSMGSQESQTQLSMPMHAYSNRK